MENGNSKSMDPRVIKAPESLDCQRASEFMEEIKNTLGQGWEGLIVDLSNVKTFDTLGISVVVKALSLAKEKGGKIKIKGASREIRDYFSLVSLERLTEPPRHGKRRFNLILFIGGLALPGVKALKLWFQVMVETFWGFFVRPFKGEPIRWDRVIREIDAVGVGAVPIISLIGFLIGLILVMQTAAKLREFGADVYVADMVGVSVTREIGPLMTAILAAARSGSSIAAEIGTMKVSEEVDALRQMGVHPVRFLVMPKIVALAISVPCLGIIFTVFAIIGGLLFGITVMGLPWGAYLDHTQAAVSQKDIIEGIIKCSVFGAIVGQVGCALGIGVEGGSIGVGKATTFSVVLSIFLIIVFDAVFVGIFRMV